MPCIEMMWIYVVAGIMWIQICSLHGCIFGPGPECVFPCRCSDAPGPPHILASGGSCDKITGQCLTGRCLQRVFTNEFEQNTWSEDGCQTGNHALGKTAFITETDEEANNLVDGWKGSVHDCTSVDTRNLSEAASVTVDLGALYKITWLGLFNTHDRQEYRYLENLFVATGSETSTEICQTVNWHIPRRGVSGIPCVPSTPVRYVTVGKLDNSTYKYRIALCEIAVYGSPYYDVDCSRCNSTEQCHPDMWCEQCVEGWTGHDCDTDPTEKSPTPLPTKYNNPCDNSQVVIPTAILSVIVLILIVLLVVSFCYIVRLRRRLKGTNADRVAGFSDMDKTVYYNTAMGQAAMSVSGIQKAAHGGDGDEYEDVSGNKGIIHQDNTGTNISPAEPQDSSYEAMQRQASNSNLPPPPAVYQELGRLRNKLPPFRNQLLLPHHIG